jgi:hypothetical protein
MGNDQDKVTVSFETRLIRDKTILMLGLCKVWLRAIVPVVPPKSFHKRFYDHGGHSTPVLFKTRKTSRFINVSRWNPRTFIKRHKRPTLDSHPETNETMNESNSAFQNAVYALSSPSSVSP